VKAVAFVGSIAVLTAVFPAFAAPGIGRAPAPGYLLLDHGSATAIAGAPQNLRNALVLLHSEAASMRAEDGGTLTVGHQRYLQTKLDRLTGKRIGTLRDL